MTILSQSLWTGLMSVAQECVVLFVFFATWSLTRTYSKAKAVDPDKAPPATTPLDRAKAIQGLCADQFTRALRMYREMVKRDQDVDITDEGFYTSLVEAAVRVGKADVAMQIVQRMAANGCAPSSAFLQSVLKLLAARRLWAECLTVYRQCGLGPAPEPLVFSCLVLGASEVGDVATARRLVDEQQLPSREAIPLARAYVKSGDWQAAVSLARQYVARGALENIVLNTCLAACARSPAAVPEMHALLDEVAALEEATGVAVTDVVSYNTLMKASAHSRDVKGCFRLLETVLKRSKPDGITFSTLLDVCIQEDEHDLASVALERMAAAGVPMTCVLMTTLMKGFVRSSRLDKALQLYATMQGGSVRPDMITYSLLIKACCDHSQMDQALRVLEDLLQSGCPVDDIVFTHLIDGCCQVSNVALAEQLFRDMLRAKIKPTVYAITGLIKVYGKCGLSEKAMAVASTMEQSYGVAPTVVVYTCVVSGLLRQKKFAEAYTCFQQLVERCPLDTHCVQTMLYGLAEGLMWTQFNDVSAQFLARGEPSISAECLQHALALMAEGNAQQARVLRGLMEKHGVPVEAQPKGK